MHQAIQRVLLRAGLVVVLGAILAACAPQPAQPARQTLPRAQCQLSLPGTAQRFQAECATLTVFEDREAGAGRTIDLRIAVLPAISNNPEPDPLFLLAGGPGQAATEAFAPAAQLFRAINQERDLVLVDQRGTGQSSPLDCTFDQASQLEIADITPWLQACLAALDAEPQFYTTTLAMQDLDAVRAALGYERINLLGVSYGTRAALTYLRMYPERVRSVVLDGVVPPEASIGLDVARDAQRAIALLFDRCAADPACAGAFPNLRQDFATLFARLDAGPRQVRVDHPVTGTPVDLQLDRATLASVIQTLSYAPETVALLPLLIHTAADRDDYSRLVAQALMAGETVLGSQSLGMRYSVLCAEDLGYTAEQARAAAEGSYMGTGFTDMLAQACQVWPRGAAPADFKQPVASDVPALLLSGEADPVTPPVNGEQVLATLPNGRHIVVPGLGHNTITSACVVRVVSDFIVAGSAANLDTSCIAGVRPAAFFIDFSGSLP